MSTFTLSPWAWALILSAAVLALAVWAQGKLLFGRTWRIRRTDPGPAAARRRTRAVALDRPGGVRLQGWLTAPTDTPPRRLWRTPDGSGRRDRPAGALFVPQKPRSRRIASALPTTSRCSTAAPTVPA